MREWEGQKTNEKKGISSNYKSIEWTKVRVQTLHDLYEAAPLGSCSISVFNHAIEFFILSLIIKPTPKK